MRVFADTNFIISAFIGRGLSAERFEIILSEHELFISQYVLDEFLQKMKHKPKYPDELLAEYNEYFSYTFQSASSLTAYELRDPDDAQVLIDAIYWKCDFLITGDNDLLEEASKVKERRITTTREFWEAIAN